MPKKRPGRYAHVPTRLLHAEYLVTEEILYQFGVRRSDSIGALQLQRDASKMREELRLRGVIPAQLVRQDVPRDRHIDRTVGLEP